MYVLKRDGTEQEFKREKIIETCMRMGASNEIADEARRRLSSLLQGSDEARENVKNMIVNVGVSADGQFGGGATSPERSRITMNLVDYADRAEDSFETLERIRTELRGIPGTEIKIDQDSNGPPTGAPVIHGCSLQTFPSQDTTWSPWRPV